MMLYIHIPFCKRKCHYCDFTSFAGCDGDFMSYTSALCREIAFRSPDFKTELSSIYLGGGTPSLLPFNFLEKIFETVEENFSIGPYTEVTMEVNPGTVTNSLIKYLPSLPVNRISIGLQSADNEELKLLGRIHTFQDFLKSYESIAKTDIDNISVDVMTGIPRQSLPSLEKTLRLITGLRPTHISTYALTLEEGTNFYRKYKKFSPPLPDEETEYTLYRLAIDYLKDKGYNRYEISNFCRDNMYSRHNMGYWNRDSYLGVGLGASSFYDGVRLKNTTDLKRYISIFSNENPDLSEDFFEEFTPISKKDAIQEFMYLGLRKTEGISLRSFEEEFHEPIESYYQGIIESFIEQGFMELNYGVLTLTDLGIDISNQVLSSFIFD